MKQVITFNTTMEALTLENKPLALGCQKKYNDHMTFLPQAMC